MIQVDWDTYFRALMPYELHYYLNNNPNIIVNEVDFLKRLSNLLEVNNYSVNTDFRYLLNFLQVCPQIWQQFTLLRMIFQ